jgi:hypothetical protein
MLDKEPAAIVNGSSAILTIAVILGFHLSPEAAASLAFILQAVSAFVVRQNVFSKATVKKIRR